MDVTQVHELLYQCKYGDLAMQTEALCKLEGTTLRSDFGVSTILELLKSEDVCIKYSAADVLAYVEDKAIPIVGPALMELLEDKEVLVRCSAIEALGDLRYAPALAPLLILVVSDKSPLVRAAAAEMISYLRDPAAIDVLESVISNIEEDRSVKYYAAISVGYLQGYVDGKQDRDATTTE